MAELLFNFEGFPEVEVATGDATIDEGGKALVADVMVDPDPAREEGLVC